MADDLSFSPVGYEPMQAEWWPVVAAHLPKPWPREAALMDLRWWRGQELATRALGMRRVASMPGRPALMARWGWADWPVRSLLRAESEWADPLRAVSSDSPAVLQPSSSDSPAVTTSNAENYRESTSDSPADLQHDSSDPPHARVDTVPPSTEHRFAEGEIVNDGISDRASAPPPEKLIEDDRMTGDDRRDTTDDGPRIGSLFPVVDSHATTDTPPQGPAAPPRLTPAQRMERAVLAVFAAYRAHHPRKAAEPSPADRKAIRAMLAECGPMDADHDMDTTARAVLLIEWVALSADTYARQLRRELPWPGGDLTRRDDLESLSRHVEKRMDAAEAWDRRGRMDAPANAAPTNGAKAGAVIDWAELRRAASLRKSTPTP